MSKQDTMPAMIACKTDPMPLTIAMRQDPRVWKSDSICEQLHVSKVNGREHRGATTWERNEISKGKRVLVCSKIRGVDGDGLVDIHMIRRHPF